MRSTVRRPVGRGRRLFATAVLVALPLTATTACSNDVPVNEDGEEQEEEQEEDD